MTVVPDAYAEYIKERRQTAEIEKIATVSLPESQMSAVALVISDALKDLATPLTPEQERVWKSILRTLMSAIRDAE